MDTLPKTDDLPETRIAGGMVRLGSVGWEITGRLSSARLPLVLYAAS